MKPIRKTTKVVSTYPTFATAGLVEDLLFVHWSAMHVIGDDDEVVVTLPDEFPVEIKIKKKGRSKYRILNEES